MAKIEGIFTCHSKDTNELNVTMNHVILQKNENEKKNYCNVENNQSTRKPKENRKVSMKTIEK